ncbi:MAG: hypothetical protein J5865_04495 [Lachnospiraceae bacterium]|nr:hypothetical protein [Lachnospiraceae bacterium]
MKRKITRGFDNFKLDDNTREQALDQILAMVSSGQADGADSRDGGAGPVLTTEKEATIMKLNRGKRFGAVAAGILGGILLLGGVAYAAGWFGLKDLAGKEQSYEASWTVTKEAWQTDDASADTKASETGQMTYYFTDLSLVGPKDSKEYKATAEWHDFYWPYYFEHADEIPNDAKTPETYYDLYGCWNQEMKDKLDEILKEYELTPHQSITGVTSMDALCEGVGIGRIFPGLGERTGRHAGSQDYWYYDDGSFYMERKADYEDENSLIFRLNCCRKGVFNDISVSIDDPSHYTEWDYTTAAGIHVSAIESTEEYLSKNGDVIDPSVIFIIDRPESFVSIHIIYENIPFESGGRSHDYRVPTREELQAFLESICLENIP